VSAPPVLVLDLGGVVGRWLPDRRLVALAQRSGLPPATVEQLVFASGFDDAGERGRFSLDEFTASLAELLGLDPIDHADGLRADWALAYEPVPSLLRALDRAGTATALFTNNGPLLDAALDHELAEVGRRFDQVCCSWRIGAAKPEPEAFARVTELLDRAPSEVVFFDDSEDNVTAAAAFGWQAHRFTTVLDLQAVLGRAR
jgi:putative hydrolase of the HAD superfamily